MATYIISFRVVNDRTYSDRYGSLVDRIKSEADGGTTWEETTSLIIIKSAKSAENLASAIYFGSSIATTDTILVVNATNGTYAARGEVSIRPHSPIFLRGIFSRGECSDKNS